MRQIGNRLGPYEVTPRELAQLRDHVRASKLEALASVYPGDGEQSLVRFQSAADADRAFELLG